MSSESDGTHEQKQVRKSSANVVSNGLMDKPITSFKQDLSRGKSTDDKVQNNTNTYLGTFSQPQATRACQVEENRNIPLSKAPSSTNTPIRQSNYNTNINKMQPPTLPQQQQPFPTSQPLPMSSKASSMVGRYKFKTYF